MPLVAASLFILGALEARAEEFAPSARTGSAPAYRPAPKTNSKLRWLPYQAEKPKADAEVQPVQYTTPAPNEAWSVQQQTPTPATRPAPGGTMPPNTLNEPQVERKATLLPAPPAELDMPLAEPPTEPKAAGEPVAQPPAFSAEEKPVPPANPEPRGSSGLPEWAPANNTPRVNSTPNLNGRNGYLGNNLPNGGSSKKNEEYHQCLSVKELEPITKVNTDILTVKGDVPKDCPWGNESRFEGRAWPSLTFTWTASALCHKPLYFEDVHLERYGHMWGPWLQPIISHARFFATVPILPYEMGLEPPHECVYVLGHYRPGSCAPYYLDPIPLSVRAALFEAGAVAGAVAIIP